MAFHVCHPSLLKILSVIFFSLGNLKLGVVVFANGHLNVLKLFIDSGHLKVVLLKSKYSC